MVIKRQEAYAILDPGRGDMIVSREEIKRVCLEYNIDVLKNNEPEDDFKEMIDMKERLHDVRMKNKLGQGSFSVRKVEYECIVKKFKDMKKTTYDFLVKGGDRF